MIPQQYNPETQKRPNKLGERDMRALFTLKYIIDRSITLADESARRAYGPYIDMPDALPPTQTPDRAVSAPAAAENQVAEAATHATHANKVVSTLAASAVKDAETPVTTPVATPNIDQIREQVNRALAGTAEPTDTRNNYELAA